MKRNETLALFEEETKALSVIRTETALSRFPMHRLSRGKEIQIELKNQGGAIHWNVSHNSKYGQPGPLAYKIDTLIINRRIDRTGRPVPTMLRLGSLREIAEEVGSGTNTTTVKQALLQNATASIAAKIHYKTHDAGEKSLEAVFTRYQVIFTGETLPNGSSADAVYLVFNSIYHDILNNAIYRPLDYDYMKALTPAAQKFYEIVSYQIYAALHHHNARARLLYSEYCLLSTAARYYDFDHVKKQMYKVHRPHIDSGYIAKVTYEATTNEAGEADWWMCYTPGRNAGREYHAFTGSSKARRSKKTPKAGLTLPLAETEKAPGQPQASGTNSQGSQPTTPASTPEQRPSKPVRARKAVPTTEGIPMEAQPGVVSS
ncbi:MAG: hypothetical protein JOZ57_04225, partial [Abitibacteriaceae bacterium]|nr:hypothetical protein [Abditibacteriaceae bacterium]